ncbi:nitrate reductase molybdenum cofactor assembly chaperone [Streptomyces mangrovisoli]|uniref:Nitrate reductase molybdenum cofactor assembly chaperone n=1 Tax=Streptomyces mangrovisoli TaxID=1428628 RepID=A0A1J4NUL4_9ACTN|nr:nitrate reductase molybdenum cofactor assembly chaperone [Streptomyces mangrovisoli]OIJ65786.1 nitrate reductase molybdenum cofactor assembly chaperone [Streptomyces mangrovisoli]
MTTPHAVVRAAVARCLVHPDDDLRAGLGLLRAALDERPGPGAGRVRAFLDHVEATDPGRLRQEYVRTFDFTGRRCLYLTWWTDGDTRRRGRSLVRFKEIYREHGWEYADAEELPDFLPAVCEFSALTGSDTLLRDHRPALELLRFALIEADSPWAHLLEALVATLPGASPRDRAAAQAMARSGPPREDVGLAPYGTPLLEVVTR